MARLTRIGILALALCTAFAMSVVASAEAKKKQPAPRVFQASVSPNAAIPEDVASGPSTPLNSTITVGKKFKGRTVGDVNVTGIQTTGSADGAANDLGFRLIAPSGRGLILLGNGFIEGTSIGPLTFDDDTFTEICYTAPCNYAPQTLTAPYAGTANLLFNGASGQGPLAALNGLPMKGTWTLSVWDAQGGGTTSVLNHWGLQITARSPVK
jgi:hypothetical protein